MKITKYDIRSQKIRDELVFACVSDLHGRPYCKVVDALKAIAPDIILLAGDIFEVANPYMEQRNRNSFEFIERIVGIAPVYYCFGNHEIYYSHASKATDRIPVAEMRNEFIKRIEQLGVNLVNDSYVQAEIKGNRIFVGGLVCGYDTDPNCTKDDFDRSFLDEYGRVGGFKVLLCHYPHYYDRHLKNTDFDLILSGHAHGGQWRIFNRGVYAPHQGIFPKYTSGIYDKRFIISRGAVNNTRPIPRFFNPTEILNISIKNDEKTR